VELKEAIRGEWKIGREEERGTNVRSERQRGSARTRARARVRFFSAREAGVGVC
jgi:hypothetical protein